ncbi:unnamed protein product [Cladocopium goreaui]|uniref:K Homology domain-containing protein n=1 Tax=Cladocopium goreaui TaxID=2562237 RepID=A0A9P1G9V9_9DINO|nr:unnamed protein product [Cladocopium goreaui]
MRRRKRPQVLRSPLNVKPVRLEGSKVKYSEDVVWGPYREKSAESSTSGSGSCTDCRFDGPVGTNAVSEGQSACTECPATNETGSIGCCPGNSEQWPLSRGFSMSLPPGKSASVMHVLSNCQDKVDPLSAELAELVISDERHFEANPLSLATIRPAGSLWGQGCGFNQSDLVAVVLEGLDGADMSGGNCMGTGYGDGSYWGGNGCYAGTAYGSGSNSDHRQPCDSHRATAPCGLELAVAATVAIFTVSMAALGDAKSTAMTSTVKEVRRSLELVPLAAGLAMAVLEAVMATNAPGVKVAKWAIGANCSGYVIDEADAVNEGDDVNAETGLGADTWGTATASGRKGRPQENPENKKSNSGFACYAKFLVPDHVAGALIGKSGIMVGEIELVSKCSLQLSGPKKYFPGTVERICIVGGQCVQDLNIAMMKIVDLFKKVQQNTNAKNTEVAKLVVKFVIPKSAASMILGPRGATIQQLTNDTGCRINMSHRIDGFQERLMVICGEEAALRKAASEILEKIQQDAHLEEHMTMTYTQEVPMGIWTGESNEPADPEYPLMPPEEAQTKTKRELIDYLSRAAPRDVLARMKLLGDIKNAVKSTGQPGLLAAVQDVWVSRGGLQLCSEPVERPELPPQPAADGQPQPLQPGLLQETRQAIRTGKSMEVQDQSVDLVFEDESPSDDSVTDVDVYVASGLEVEEERVEVMETDEVKHHDGPVADFVQQAENLALQNYAKMPPMGHRPRSEAPRSSTADAEAEPPEPPQSQPLHVLGVALQKLDGDEDRSPENRSQDLGQPEEEPRCAHILPVGPVGTPLPTAQFPEDEVDEEGLLETFQIFVSLFAKCFLQQQTASEEYCEEVREQIVPPSAGPQSLRDQRLSNQDQLSLASADIQSSVPPCIQVPPQTTSSCSSTAGEALEEVKSRHKQFLCGPHDDGKAHCQLVVG